MVSDLVELSFVVPVYNGEQTMEAVVSHILELFSRHAIEIVLVNDGSDDGSEKVCRDLVEQHPSRVVLVHLAKNFGEHNAVLAGLHQTRGLAVAVLDDDGQNPPEEVLRMWRTLREGRFDVVYGRYRSKQHNWFRNLGSWLNDRMATRLLRKPASIYLSSFKVMNRFVVHEVLKYRGPYPYLDGLIFRATRNIGQVDVRHAKRSSGQSGYTLRKLFRLWLNMFLGFSITPLRLSVVTGLLTSVMSALLMVGIVVDKQWFNPQVPVGIPSVLALITFFGGVQLTVLGTVGEYVGRIFMAMNGMPQFVVREVVRGTPTVTAEKDSGAYPVLQSGDLLNV
jgi:undecaprenyl-phosphate 4-deoxy-4-formamido-L-arabinose transferase